MRVCMQPGSRASGSGGAYVSSSLTAGGSKFGNRVKMGKVAMGRVHRVGGAGGDHVVVMKADLGYSGYSGNRH